MELLNDRAARLRKTVTVEPDEDVGFVAKDGARRTYHFDAMAVVQAVCDAARRGGYDATILWRYSPKRRGR